MKNYELSLILAPELMGETLTKALQNIIGFIQDKGGLLEKQKIKGKQRNGILAILAFSLKQEEIENLNKKIKDEKQILRSMVTITPRRKTQVPTLAKQTAQPISALKTPEEEKLSVEDIDKKLEEIFKDIPALQEEKTHGPQ